MRCRLAFLLLVAACGDDPKKPPEPTSVPPEPPPVASQVAWKRAETHKIGWDLDVSVPETWIPGNKVLDEGRQIHFRGPGEDGGFSPELQFGWKGSDVAIQDLVRKRIADLERMPDGRVEAQGPVTVGGMPGTYFVYASKDLREINFYFGGHGHIGFVRGVCPARLYPECLPVYREAATRVRYRQ